jgi:hypothetical protein
LQHPLHRFYSAIFGFAHPIVKDKTISRPIYGRFSFWAGPPERLVSLRYEMEKDPLREGLQKEFYNWLVYPAEFLLGPLGIA